MFCRVMCALPPAVLCKPQPTQQSVTTNASCSRHPAVACMACPLTLLTHTAAVYCHRCKPTEICRIPCSMLNSMRLRPIDCRKTCSGCKLNFRKYRSVMPGLVACIPALLLFCCLSGCCHGNHVSADACGPCIFVLPTCMPAQCCQHVGSILLYCCLVHCCHAVCKDTDRSHDPWQ